MNWDKQNSLILIYEYRSRTCLWDPKDPFYKSTHSKNDAWQAIGSVFNVDKSEVKKKMKGLLSSFRTEKMRQKYRLSRSKWYAFNALSFLFNRNVEKKDTDLESNNVQEINEDSNIDDNFDEDINDIKFEMVDTPVHVDDINEDNLETSSNSSMTNSMPVNDTTNYQPPQKKVKLKKVPDESSYNLTSLSTLNCEKSVSDFFGGYIISKLKKYNETVSNVVQHRISQILFEADIGEFDKQTSRPKSSQEDSNDSQDNSHKE